MEKIFENGSKVDDRKILIKIDEGNIEFFFYDQYLRKNNWIMEMEEKRRNGECDDLPDEEKEVYGFYWINKDEWIRDKKERLDREDNWHTHMKEKMWFSNDMENFINQNT